MKTSNRRREIRLALPECVVSGPSASGRILDISSSGVGVEMESRCVFARGELHRLVLSDLSHSVEVEGEVRWTQSGWGSPDEPQRASYFQTAGLELSRLLTEHPGGVWSGLLPSDTPSVEVATPQAPPPVPQRRVAPPLTMVEPPVGSTHVHECISVICTIEDPESITGIRINGVEANVMGDLATAKVKLHKGVNRIVSMVSRRTGTYSTYVLGQVVRPRTP